MSRCYLFDLDGTVADISHRLHYIEGDKKDWRSFFAECHLDQPILPMMRLVNDLARANTALIIFVSGRSDECRQATETWLRSFIGNAANRIYMRRAGDHRPDDIVKMELLEQMRADGFDPLMVFDDRAVVVAAWRAAGLLCAQVAPGEF